MLNSSARRRLGLDLLLDFFTSINVESVTKLIQSYGVYAIFIAMALTLIQSCFPYVPFFVLAGANAIVFGFVWGGVISYSMAVCGALVSFWFARFIGHDYIQNKLRNFPRARRWNRLFARNGFLYVLLARLIVVLPSTMVNSAAGISKVRMRAFIAGTILGLLPVVVLETMIGHDLFTFSENKGRLTLFVVIFVLLIAFGAQLRKQIDSRR